MARAGSRPTPPAQAELAAGEGLTSLVYVSTATHMLTLAEIDHLLQRARSRNAEHSVSGVLLYADGNFMQYIEGPPAGLDAIYRVIVADRMHHGIIELVRESIAARAFSDWSMAFRATRGRLSQREPDAELNARLESGDGPSARWMLRKFWNRGQGPLAL